jgi:threonine/homoserine/homoserine lactone efflux protein
MLSTLASGVLLGLSAGLVPGPMLALVLTQSLRHGAREGCKVALVPLLTDAPIIVLTLALAAEAAKLQTALGILSMAGGAFVMYLAFDAFRPARMDLDAAAVRPKSLAKGIVTNVLNPHPWLFWLTIGAATLAPAIEASWLEAAAFLVVFYLMLVGSKMVLAVAVGRSKDFLGGGPYRFVMRLLGALLATFAVLLFHEGLKCFSTR